MTLPKELIIYICDYDDEMNPIYAAAKEVSDIGEQYDGHDVGVYTLNRKYTFKVKRELK